MILTIDQGLSKRLLLFIFVLMGVITVSVITVSVITMSMITVGVITMSVITMGVIMAMAMAMSKDGKLDDVEEETCPSSDHHEVFLDLRRVKNSQGGLIKQPNCQTPEEDNT
jgi:hypothetical protein